MAQSNNVRSYDFFDDDTFNFLVELNVVCEGIYQNMISFAASDPQRVYRTILSCKKSWPKYFGHLNPNVFQIVLAVRRGILKPTSRN